MIIPIYPDRPLWWKRVIHTIVLCSISVNIFLNQLNNLLYQKAEELVQATNDMLPSAVKVAKSLEEHVVPALQYIETSKLVWVAEQFELPSSKSLEQEINNISKLEKTCSTYQSIFLVAYSIVKLTNLLMWWPIIFSLRWLYRDLLSGPTKLLTTLCLLIGVTVNVLMYNYLNTHWAYIFQ